MPHVRVGPDGFAEIEVEGLSPVERQLGAPEIPTRTLWVAIPPDADPSIEVRPSGFEVEQPGVVPRPVARRWLELAPDDAREVEAGRATTGRLGLLQRRERETREVDDRIYHGDGTFPRRLAWIGGTGYLRDQRYVEVHVAPVRFDPAIEGLRSDPSVEIVVQFNRSSDEPLTAAAVDARFEDLYRTTFVNYDQSRFFRRSTETNASKALFAASQPVAAGTTPRERISIDRTGLVRLDWTLLQSTGFPSYDLSTWLLTNRGVPVPLQIQDDGDGILEPGEWVQFYGQALDDEPKTEVNTDYPDTSNDLFEARDFTDVNTYFLTVDAQPVAAMPERDSAPTFSRTPPTSFRSTAHAEVDDGYRPLGGADPWYWLPTLLVSSPQAATREDVVPLPGLFSGTEPATLRVHVRGIDEDLTVNPDHLTRVTLRNASNQVLAVDDGAFDNRTLFTHVIDWTWPGGAALSDPARVQLEVLTSGATCLGHPCNSVILDYIEIEYTRSFTTADDELVFEWPDQDAEFTVGGLSQAAAEVYEITQAAGQPVIQPVRLANVVASGSGPYSVRFRVDQDPALPDGTPRRFVVIGEPALNVPVPADLEPDTESDLRDPANQADLIVIASESVLDASPTGPLAQLLAYRATPAGGNLSSKVVLLQDVYDEFQYGLPGPTAIREFLRWVLSDLPGEGWSDPKPAYVILLGDGSADYKSGELYGNFVPTQIIFKDNPLLGFYASDNVMGAVVGNDQMADVVIGRIPARNVTDANRMLQKILDYEQGAAAGTWRDRVLFISDRGKAGTGLQLESEEFEAINDEAAQWISTPTSVRKLRYWSDYFNTPDPTPWDSINFDIKAAVNGTDGMSNGSAIVNYIGHGNYYIWSDDFYWDERVNPPTDTFQDSMDLVNSGRLTWLVSHNCLTGGFQLLDYNSIGENWLKLDGGGAVGVFAPSGLSTNYVGAPASSKMFEKMFGPEKKRLVGDVVFSALTELCARGSLEACQYYEFLGDPATRLVMRDVDPASNLVAATGVNQQVDLSWVPSATAGATHDVWRVEIKPNTPIGPYTRVATAISGTSFADTTVTNTRTYRYYVVAKDPEGFESAWSNFNSDCASQGPDCVEATPYNPDPPLPPVGLQVDDLGVGTALRVFWTPNTENDLLRYTVHYGTASGVYDHAVNTALMTATTITDLVEGQTYYFSVTATNTSGGTSDYSDEASDHPVFGLGIRAPRYIDDLRARREGSDIVLDWTEVTTDFYDKPETVTHYEILRGTSPNYDVAALAVIGTCTAPCASYTDNGAAVVAGDFHYRVRAVDQEGNPGGLGSNPPLPVELFMNRSMSVPGNLVLTWTPVSKTVDGQPAQIDHYRIYGSDQPFSRENIRDGLLAPIATVPGPDYEFTPPAQSRYYSVLAVDTRGNVSPY